MCSFPGTQPSLTPVVVSPLAVPTSAHRSQHAGQLCYSPFKHVLRLGRHGSLHTCPAPWARCLWAIAHSPGKGKQERVIIKGSDHCMYPHVMRSQGAVHMQSMKKLWWWLRGKADWPIVWNNPTGDNGFNSAVCWALGTIYCYVN